MAEDAMEVAPDWAALTEASSSAPPAAALDDWSSLAQCLADGRSGRMPRVTAVMRFWADAAEDDDAASRWADYRSDDLSEDVVAAVNCWKTAEPSSSWRQESRTHAA